MNIAKTIFFLMLAVQLQAQTGINFFHGTWQEALDLAKKEHKIIFMDAFAEWCGPCKRMAKEVFSLKEVGDVYNKHFINVKMDMEKGEGPKLSSKFKISAYPTLLFIDAAGEVVNVNVGGLGTEQFIALAKTTLNKYDKSKDFETEYANGNRDPEMLKAYSYALLMSGKPTLKIANEYIKSQGKSDKDDLLDFIFDFATEADCTIFDKLVEHREKLIKMKGEEAFRRKVQKACEATVDKAIEFETPELVAEAKKQMKLAMPSFAAEYSLMADIHYGYASNDLEKTIGATDKYVQKFAKNDAEKLFYHAQMFNQFVKDQKALSKAEKWAANAYSLKKTAKYGRTYADLLRKNGKEADAKKIEIEIASLPKD